MIRIRCVAFPGRLPAGVRDQLKRMDARIFFDTFRMTLEGCRWWVAYDGVRPVAFAGIKSVNGDTMFLCRAGVIPEYRGRGLHRRLIAVRLRYARRLGMMRVVTYTVDNPKSSNALVSCGFRFYKPSRKFAISDVHYLRLILRRRRANASNGYRSREPGFGSAFSYIRCCGQRAGRMVRSC